MEIKKVTADYRRQQWIENIRACKASGQSNTRWCEENQINIKSFLADEIAQSSWSNVGQRKRVQTGATGIA